MVVRVLGEVGDPVDKPHRRGKVVELPFAHDLVAFPGPFTAVEPFGDRMVAQRSAIALVLLALGIVRLSSEKMVSHSFPPRERKHL